jgi:thiosulfate sulfurtransferase
MAEFQTITVSAMKSMLNEDEIMLLDCRKLQDYRTDHIENAMYVHEDLKESLLKRSDKSKKMIIYCYHGHSSEHLAQMFVDFGYKQVFSLKGGFEAWKENT